MAILCLQYLTFDCFALNISDEQMHTYIREGYLSFQDYAVSRWFHHLQTVIETCGEYVSNTTNGIPKDLCGALDDFTTIFGHQIHLDEAEDIKWLQQAGEDCRSFKDPDLNDYLVKLWAHVCKHQRTSDAKKLDKIGIPEMASAVKRNRDQMEEIGKNRRFSAQYETFYGRNHFKCDRLTCPYFHDGFENCKDRDQHIARHERPFQCVVEACDQSNFGFTTNKQLKNHMSSYHPEMCDLTTMQAQFALLNQRTVQGTRFVCNNLWDEFHPQN